MYSKLKQIAKINFDNTTQNYCKLFSKSHQVTTVVRCILEIYMYMYMQKNVKKEKQYFMKLI